MKIPSHSSSYLCFHNLVPKGQKLPSTWSKASVCTQTGPKGLYLIHIICISISVCISCMYLCNHHTTCICPRKAKAPKHTAQSLYVCSNGPQRPLISSRMYHCIWREWYCLMTSKAIISLIFTYLLTIL